MPASDADIFELAIEVQDPELREKYVRQACGDDSDQCQRVLLLLNSHQQLGESAASGFAIDRASEIIQSVVSSLGPQSGADVGGYKLLRKLGEGGMGVVYAAQQDAPLRRTVALKLLKPGMDSQRILGRFAMERQVLAQLNHPGICRVLDAGIQDNGRPFFAMELIRDPRKITDYCDQQRLDVHARIRIMLSVCHAVHHAHQRGIIHRDLKPSNILIPGNEQQPNPRVIDFGVAKVLNAEGDRLSTQTDAAERLGTPAYMSPEQALQRGGVTDVRTDLYSLGVILHELLTGSTPHGEMETGDLSWTTDAYWDQPQRRPSSYIGSDLNDEISLARNCTAEELRRRIHGDLDAILLKALARDRDDRYASVTEFQRDLERFLDGEPVEAASPGHFYHLKKLIQRHRILAFTVMASAILILTASVIAFGFGIRAHHAEQEADLRLANALQSQAELRQQKVVAEQASARAFGLLRAFKINEVAMAAMRRLVAPMLAAGRTNDIAAFENMNSPGPITADILTEPAHRLIIKGDWSWTNSQIEITLQAGAIGSELTSAEIAELCRSAEEESSRNLSKWFPSDGPVSTRFAFQMLLLEELRRELSASDPLIAEVLDNCGLLASDMRDPEAAMEFLQQAVQVWETHDDKAVNAVQSRLFLAEACLDHGALVDAASAISTAETQLARLHPSTAETTELVNFCGMLRQRLKRSGFE